MTDVTAVQLAAESLGKDILQAIIDELNRTEWALRPEGEQQLAVARLRTKSSELIAQALSILFSGGAPACEARIESVTIKNGLKVQVKIAKGQQNWPDVVEHEGQKILLVMADPEIYRTAMEAVKARADQGDLFNGTYQGTNEFRRDEKQVLPAKSWADVTGKSLEEFEQTEPEGVNDATIAALEAIHVHVDAEKVEKWTEAECACAYEWAKAFAKDPDTAPARPWWLPIPIPPATSDSAAESETEMETTQSDSNEVAA